MAKQKPLSRYRREGNVSFVLTARDVDILRAVNRCRYLRTGQIHRLVFPDCRSNQSARRRLKYIYHNQYLGRIAPFTQAGQGSGEMAYFLDQAGAEFLRDVGKEPLSLPRNHRVRHAFPWHALDIADFRVHLECALRRFTADFELKEPTKSAIGNKRYRLYDEVLHPINKQRYVVYPDALIILQGKGEHQGFQRLFFLEIDRGTAPLGAIRDKVIGYNLYRRLGIFKKFGRFDRFRVLIQTSSQKREANIRTALTDQEGADLVWVTDVSRVTEKTLLEAEIWQDEKRHLRSVLKRPSA